MSIRIRTRWSCLIRGGVVAFSGVLLMLGSGTSLRADEPVPSVELSVPDELELKALVDAVSRETGLKIIYDEKIAAQKITIRSPGKIPAESLEALLQSTLRMHGLALIDSEVKGWKTVVDASQKQRMFELGTHPRTKESPPALSDAPILTQIFELEFADPTQVQTAVSGLLTAQGGNAIVLPEQRMIIITDFSSVVTKVAGIIKLMDRPRHLGRVEFIEITNIDAQSLSEQITDILSARSKGAGSKEGEQGQVTVTPDTRSNRLIVVGEADLVEMVQGLVAKLDVSLGHKTEVYSPRALSAERLDKLVRDIAESDEAHPQYRGVVDSEGNLLIATTTPAIHKSIAQLIERLDGPQATQRNSRIRFYKLKHITAEGALKTIRGIQGNGNQAPDAGAFGGNNGDLDGRFRIQEGQVLPGPNRPQFQGQPGLQGQPGQQPRQDLPQPPGFFPPQNDPNRLDRQADQPAVRNRNPFGGGNPLELQSAAGLAIENAKVSADIKTNSLIVVGEPEVQEVYAELISKLDQPQPQVLIEAKVVILDTSDNFSLGVEISGGDRTGAKKLFAFSSYGLSTVNPVNGALSIVPGLGFNGTLVNPDAADVVLRAFTRHKRAKVVSSPRVLVSSNAKGVLSSVSEVPFTSVNASQTVSTTSFAGFAQAGTTIEVTPHISDGERLQLKYRITRNDFTGAASGPGVPPPRQTDEIVSEVVIPDGHTLIVGGLSRISTDQSLDSFPFLENIPLLRSLVSNKSNNGKQTSLFIFLKPVILRDDKFEDLKYYSERDLERSVEPGDFPASLPVLLR